MNRILPAAATLWADAEEVAALADRWEGDENKATSERVAYSMVRRHPHSSILDLGCGDARFADSMRGWWRYVGVDLSPHMIESAKARLVRLQRSTELVTADIREWKTDEEFDLVICMHLSQHYDDPLGFIAAMLDRFQAKHFLVTFVVHDGDDTLEFFIDAVVVTRSIAKASMGKFLEGYSVVRTEKVPGAHEKAQYYLVLLEGGANGS